MNSTDDSTSYNAARHAQAVADYVQGVPTMIHTGHVERLEYGWWERKRGHIMLPCTLGKKNNYVLTHEELCAYDHALLEMKQWVEKEQARTATTLVALRRGRSRTYPWDRNDPTCFTIAHSLESMIWLAKWKLGVMHILNYIAKERALEKRLVGETDPSAGSTDPR